MEDILQLIFFIWVVGLPIQSFILLEQKTTPEVMFAKIVFWPIHWITLLVLSCREWYFELREKIDKDYFDTYIKK